MLIIPPDVLDDVIRKAQKNFGEVESGKCKNPCSEPKVYHITIGAHLDGPGDKIGHAFISIEYPLGVKTTKGFWPKNGFDLGEKDDRKGVVFGMDGAVLSDEEYLSKPNVRMKTFDVTETQAQAALAKIKEYEDTKPKYNLITNQCATFATAVLRAAGYWVRAGTPPRPTVLYKSLR